MHTPGPWSIITRGPRGNYERGIGQFKGTSGRFRPIATIDGEIDGPETESNACLIAAAPDLIEALDYLLEQTVDMDLKHGIGLTEGETEAREKALAAILKAKGEK